MSPESEGLFSGAIMESGSCDTNQFFQSMDEATSFGYDYAAGCGCNFTGPALLGCLRGLSAVDLMGCNASESLSAHQNAVGAAARTYAQLFGESMASYHLKGVRGCSASLMFVGGH